MLITIEEWDKRTFKKTHCMATLYSWARTQQTEPPAFKAGGEWVIDEDAVYVGLREAEPATNVPDRVLEILNDVT